MKPRSKLLAAVLALAVVGGLSLLWINRAHAPVIDDNPPSQPSARVTDLYPLATDAAPFYFVPEIDGVDLVEGEYFNTSGYVIGTSFCPPCPEGAKCKACEMPYIIVADDPSVDPRIGPIVKIETNHSELFPRDQRYVFTVDILTSGKPDGRAPRLMLSGLMED